MKSNTIWALVTGLAVGFLVGREFGTGKSDGPGAKSGSSGSTATSAAPGEIPKEWLTESDLKAAEKMAGMSAGQKFAVLKVMNEKPCDCGCPHGSTAKCLKDDPACPRAPKILEQAIALAKDGKNADQILAAVKKPDAPQQPPAPSGPQKIEVAAWNPTKGPKDAKVTIIEFSDFQ
jgi:hypothetical protein